jgi:hypothetical protein
MGWFKQRKSCEEMGIALAESCMDVVKEGYHRLKSIIALDGTGRKLNGLSLDKELAAQKELAYLAMFAFRVGMQSTNLSDDKLQRILNAYDQTTVVRFKFTKNDGEMLQHRGEQYFEMFKLYQQGNSQAFTGKLKLHFTQFCLGAKEINSPFILGDFLSKSQMGDIACEVCGRSFSIVAEAMKNCNLS